MSWYLPLTLAQNEPAPAAPANGGATPSTPAPSGQTSTTGETVSPPPAQPGPMMDTTFLLVIFGMFALMMIMASRRERK
ncbi:MAG: hypothetical protein ACYTGQ_13220, partial [Planctomycetota bacterium]